MDVRCEERFGSPQWTEGPRPTIKLLYQVLGVSCDDDSAAMGMVIATSPTEYQGLLRRQVQLEPAGPEIWFASVDYDAAAADQGTWEYQFDGSGGTQKITQSISTRSRTPINGPAIDFGGAIGVTDSGIDGCDIVIPKFSFGICYRFSSHFVTSAYGVVCGNLAGKINNAPFWGFATGTLLYMGPVGKFSGSLSAGVTPRSVEITHRFDYSPHMNVRIANTTVQKQGWDYLWVRYIQTKDSTNNARIQSPQAAYCEVVYESANFGALGIGR